MRYPGRLLPLFILATGFLTAAGPVRAEPEIEIGLKPSSTLKKGEGCLLTIQITWRSTEANYLFTEPEIPLEHLVLEEVGDSNETFQKAGEEWKRKIFRYHLKAVESGRGRIQAFRLNYIDPEKQRGGHFDIPSREVKIAKDRSKLYRTITFLLGLLAAGGLMGASLFWRRSRSRFKEGASPELTLEDRYLDRLNGLKERMGEERPIRNQAFEVAQVFRSYLSEKYSIAREGTTSLELIGQMEQKVSPSEMKALRKTLDQLDEWCYADRPSSRDETRGIFEEIMSYVQGKRVIAF